MKRVLVTGAAGFIGRKTLSLLAAKNYDVHAVCLNKEEACFEGAEWHGADLLDSHQVKKLATEVKATHLLHFAWYTEHKKYWNARQNYDWVKASLVIAEEFRAHGGKRAVMAGTCAEYDWTQGICFESKTPLTPATLYGQCKNDLRQKLEDLSKKTGLSFAWGRIFFVYGPGESPERLVPSVICSLINKKSVACSEGLQKRDFMFADDVASAFVELLDSDITGAVNMASGVEVSIKDMIEAISKKLNGIDLVRFGGLVGNPDEPPLLVADVQRLRNELHWRPRHSLDQGLDLTIQWWKDHFKRYDTR